MEFNFKSRPQCTPIRRRSCTVDEFKVQLASTVNTPFIEALTKSAFSSPNYFTLIIRHGSQSFQKISNRSKQTWCLTWQFLSFCRVINRSIMEKRRRARINNCLNDLKTLILDAMKKDVSVLTCLTSNFQLVSFLFPRLPTVKASPKVGRLFPHDFSREIRASFSNRASSCYIIVGLCL